jgi:hypothetical protein
MTTFWDFRSRHARPARIPNYAAVLAGGTLSNKDWIKWSELHDEYGFSFLLTNRLYQDCLENLFQKQYQTFFLSRFPVVLVDEITVLPPLSNCKADEDATLLPLASAPSAQDLLNSKMKVDLVLQRISVRNSIGVFMARCIEGLQFSLCFPHWSGCNIHAGRPRIRCCEKKENKAGHEMLVKHLCCFTRHEMVCWHLRHTSWTSNDFCAKYVLVVLVLSHLLHLFITFTGLHLVLYSFNIADETMYLFDKISLEFYTCYLRKQ